MPKVHITKKTAQGFQVNNMKRILLIAFFFTIKELLYKPLASINGIITNHSIKTVEKENVLILYSQKFNHTFYIMKSKPKQLIKKITKLLHWLTNY